MLCDHLCILNTSDQLRSVLPELRGFRCSSSLLRVRPPLDPQPVFIRSLRWLIVPLGVANSTTGFPRLLPLSDQYAAGIMLQWSQDFAVVSCSMFGCFSRLVFHRGNSPLAPVSPHNGCLIMPCSQLRPPDTESGHRGQIGSHTWVW